MFSNILDNKILMTIIVGIASLLAVAIWNAIPSSYELVTHKKSKKTKKDKPTENKQDFKITAESIKKLYSGKILENKKRKDAFFEIISASEKNNKIAFTYNLKIDFIPILIKQEAVLDKKNMSFQFKLNKENQKYKYLIKELNNSHLELNKSNNKLIIKENTNKWKMEEIQLTCEELKAKKYFDIYISLNCILLEC